MDNKLKKCNIRLQYKILESKSVRICDHSNLTTHGVPTARLFKPDKIHLAGQSIKVSVANFKFVINDVWKIYHEADVAFVSRKQLQSYPRGRGRRWFPEIVKDISAEEVTLVTGIQVGLSTI